jgi:hypothetical protein
MESTVSIIDLESVAPEDRRIAFARHAAEHVQAQEFGAVVEQIVADSELRPADGESDSDFMERLHIEGALKCYSPLKDTPFTLFYLYNKPLIGFLPPSIDGKQIADDASAMTITINVVQAELMPEWGDSDGVKKLVLSYILSKLLGGKG